MEAASLTAVGVWPESYPACHRLRAHQVPQLFLIHALSRSVSTPAQFPISSERHRDCSVVGFQSVRREWEEGLPCYQVQVELHGHTISAWSEDAEVECRGRFMVQTWVWSPNGPTAAGKAGPACGMLAGTRALSSAVLGNTTRCCLLTIWICYSGLKRNGHVIIEEWRWKGLARRDYAQWN